MNDFTCDYPCVCNKQFVCITMFDDEEFDLIENCNEDDLYAFLGIGKNVRINEIIDFI